jgi:hypothetical protein
MKFCAYQSAETTLYDLQNSPHETSNVVHVPSYAPNVASLGRRLDSLKLLP